MEGCFLAEEHLLQPMTASTTCQPNVLTLYQCLQSCNLPTTISSPCAVSLLARSPPPTSISALQAMAGPHLLSGYRGRWANLQGMATRALVHLLEHQFFCKYCICHADLALKAGLAWRHGCCVHCLDRELWWPLKDSPEAEGQPGGQPGQHPLGDSEALGNCANGRGKMSVRNYSKGPQCGGLPGDRGVNLGTAGLARFSVK